MANYFVSAATGNDSTGNGLTPGTAWATIGAAIGPSPKITLSGGTTVDRIYVEPGLYREVVTFSLAPTSTNTFEIIGDYTGANFAAAGGAGTVGLIDWRGWSNDTTQLSSKSCLYATGVSYVTVRGVKQIGSSYSSGGCIVVEGTWSNWTIQDCEFCATGARPICCYFYDTASQVMNLTIDRCDFASVTGVGASIQLKAPLIATAEYSINVLIQNCRFIGGNYGVNFVNLAGSGTFCATGITVQNCTAFSSNIGVYYQANITLTTPIGVYGCAFILCGFGVAGINTSNVIEDYNTMNCTTPRSNTNAGSHSVTTICPAVNLQDSRISGGVFRPFLEPMVTSPFNAFGAGGTPPTVDLYNQTRPGTISSGALERDVFTVATSTYIFNVDS